MQSETISKQEYKHIEERTVSLNKVTLLAFPLFIPAFLIFGLPYLLIWKADLLHALFHFESWLGMLKVLWREISFLSQYSIHAVLVFIAGIFLHELLHGLIWAVGSENGWKAIRFGVKWEQLTPYTHCIKPLKLNVYRLGGAMPAIVLGIIPGVIGIIIGHSGLTIFGLFFTWAAVGDFYVLWLLRGLPTNTLLLDHPDKAGCIVVEKLSSTED